MRVVAQPATLLAVVAVLAYRQFLSPRKGYGCPHRLLTGGRSCSDHGLRVLRRVGIGGFRPLMRRRFARCRAAGRVLARRPGVRRETKDQRLRRREHAAGQAPAERACDVCGSVVVPTPCDLWIFDCGPTDVGCGDVDVGCFDAT